MRGLGIICKDRFNLFLLSFLMISFVVLSMGNPCVYAADPTERDNISSIASSGNIIVGVEGMDITSDEEELLKKINEARKAACDNGEPDPRDRSRKLQPGDYVPLKIGKKCKQAAQIRACEASLEMAHVRPNGTMCTEILVKINPSNALRAENLAWDSSGESSVGLWLDERNAYLGLESGQSGHYATIINPDYEFTGMATFNPSNDSNEYDWACTAGQYAKTDEKLEEAYYEAKKNEHVIQKIEVPISAVTGMSILGESSLKGNSVLQKDKDYKLSMYVGVKFSTEVSTNSVTSCRVYNAVAWQSSNDAVISIDETGNIKAESIDEAKITAAIGTGTDKKNVTKDYIVTDGTVTVSSIDDPPMITVGSNIKPELPITVKAKLSNDKTAEIGVVWNGYDESKLLTYFKSREFNITGKADGIDVTQKIHVNAAIMTGTFTDPSVIITDPGVEPSYPKAKVGMSNGYMFTDIDVVWDAASLEYYKKAEGGTFTMKGKTEYEFPTDKEGKHFDVELTLIVKSPTPEPEPEPEPKPLQTEESETPGTGGSGTPGSGETPGNSGKPGSDGTTGSGETRDSGSDSTSNDSQTTPYDSITVGEEQTVGDVKYQVTNVVETSNKDYAGEVTYAQNNKKVSSAEIPAEVLIGGKKYRVTSIEKNAFKGNKKLTKITVGKYVKKIGDNAFCNCSKLKKITFKGTSVKKIGKNAFKGVPKKAVAKVPKKVRTKYKKLLKKAKYKGKLG